MKLVDIILENYIGCEHVGKCRRRQYGKKWGQSGMNPIHQVALGNGT
jgi:hypothetical protein